MPSCNVVFGRTGCGKTSLLNMLSGQKPERASFRSGTEKASVRDVAIDGQAYKYVDTAGILDNRGGDADSKRARTDHVNSIARLLKESGLDVARVLYCVTISDRLLQEEIAWLADIVHMLGGEKVLQCFAIVLTKADEGSPQKDEFDQEGESMELVKALRLAFQHCPIVTSGLRNLDDVKKLLIPEAKSLVSSIKPDQVKVIEPMNEIEAQLSETEERIEAVEDMLLNKQTRNQHILYEIEKFEEEVKHLLTRTEGRCFPFWDEHLSKENADRVTECLDTIKIMRGAADKVAHDHVAFEEQKKKLLRLLKKAKKEVKQRRAWAETFRSILTLGFGLPEGLGGSCFEPRKKSFQAARKSLKAAGVGLGKPVDPASSTDCSGDEFELLSETSSPSSAFVRTL